MKVLLSELLVLLLFLPGIPVLLFVRHGKFRQGASILETIVAGSVLWNYLFIMPSALMGGFLSLATVSFWPLVFLGSAFTLGGVWTMVRGLNRRTAKGLRLLHWELLFPIAVFSLLLFLLSEFHPLFIERDAVSFYLPAGRSVATTGRLFSIYWNSYFPVSESILLSLVYSWAFIVQGDVPRLLPVVYAMLIGISVFAVSRRMGSSIHVAAVSCLAFLSIPSVVNYLAVDSLITDLPFIFYMTAAILFLIVYGQTRSPQALFFASSSVALSTLAKPLGFILVPLIGAVIILRSRKLRSWILYPAYAILCMSTFLFFITWNIISYPTSSASYFARTLEPLLPVVVLGGMISVFAYWFRPCISGMISKWEIVATLPILLLAIFLLQQFLAYGFLFTWGPALTQGNNLLNSLQNSNSPAVATGQTGFAPFFAWYPIFISIALGGSVALPLIIGLVQTARKKSWAGLVVLSWFLLLMMTWTLFFQNSFSGSSEYRRLLMFSPLVAIFVGQGVHYVSRKLSIDEKHAWYGFVIFCCFLWIYTWAYYNWTYYIRVDIADNIVSLKNIGAIIDVYSAGLYLSAFVLIFAGIAAFERVKLPQNFRFRISTLSRGTLLVYLILFSFTALNLSVIAPFIVHIDPATGETQHYDSIYQDLGLGISQVIKYYVASIKDSYSTLGFRIYYLSWYANRSIVDLWQNPSYSTISQILESDNASYIIDQYYASNIRYFLVPKTPGSPEYALFRQAQEQFGAIKLIQNNARFALVQNFDSLKLYKLLSPDEYQQHRARLRSLFYLENRPLVLSDENQAASYFANYPQVVRFSNDNTTEIIGNDSLRIDISSYPSIPIGSGQPVIRHRFQTPLNLLSFGFVAFYWQGENTGKTISIRLVSNYPDDQFSYEFTDDWNGWARVIIPLSSFGIIAGQPDMSQISGMAIVLESFSMATGLTFHLDRLIVDSGIPDPYIIRLDQFS